jgi:outer membrane protein OmpU
MNNMKKIGVTALAGSLAMFSANADLTMSGSAEATYIQGTGSGTGAAKGDGIGLSHDINITGTGEFDNGFTYSVNTNFAGQDMAADSAILKIDMGDLGVVAIDQGSGAFGIGTLENEVPTAYEEADHGVGVLAHGIDAGGDTNVIGYSNSVQGVGISIEVDRDTTTETYAQAGAGSGALASGRSVNWALQYAVPGFDGLVLALGAAETKYSNDTSDTEDTAAINYTLGAISAGYQLSNTHPVSGVTAQEIEAMGIAFNVNDQLSVSYSKNDNEQAGVTEESSGLQAAYSMGSASVRIAFNEADNYSGESGVEAENTEISLSLAF